MNISFDGFNGKLLTFAVDSEIEPGTLVTIYENGKVNAAIDDDFIGVVINCDGRYAGVQVEGAVTVPYRGNSIAAGYSGLLADSNGRLTAGEARKDRIVLDADSEAKTVTFIL